jgi:hypothetical protein
VTTRSALYWVMRVLAAGLGCLLVMSGGAGLLVPGIVHSAQPDSPQAWLLARDVACLLAGMSLLLPYRLTVRPWQMGMRLAIAVGVSGLVTVLAFEGVTDYARGGRHWAIIPTAVVALLSAWSALGSLLMARARLRGA